MKKTSSALPLALAVLVALSLAACSSPTGEGETTQPEDTAPTVTEPESTGSPAPEVSAPTETSYDFSGIELPAPLADGSGFGSSRWEDDAGTVLKQELAGRENVSSLLVSDYAMTLAGLNFAGEFLFQQDENGQAVLVAGIYWRANYLNAFDALPGMEQAVSDYNLLLAYLTEQYGTPAQSFIDIDGSSHVDVEDNINQFIDLKAREAVAIWRTAREDGNSRTQMTLALSARGKLEVEFFSPSFGAR